MGYLFVHLQMIDARPVMLSWVSVCVMFIYHIRDHVTYDPKSHSPLPKYSVAHPC